MSRKSFKGSANPAAPAAGVKVSRPNTGLAAHLLNDGNAYLQSLLHPATVFGAKIPDGSYPESSTVTEFTRTFFSGGTDTTGSTKGVRCLVLGVNRTDGGSTINARFSLVPGNEQITNTNYNFKLGFISGPTCTDSDIWSGTPELIEHAGESAILGAVRQLRLVSCAARLTCAASGLTNKGWASMAFLPKGYGRAGWFNTAATALTQLQKLPGLVTEPIASMGDGLTAIYTPADNSCFEYVPNVQDVPSDGWDSVSFSRHDIGGFVVFTTGTDTSSPPPFLLEVVCNYEVLPASNAVLYTTTAAPDDPLALSHAMNVAATVDNVKKGAGGFDHSGEGTPVEAATPISRAGTTVTGAKGKVTEVILPVTGSVSAIPSLCMTSKARGKNKVLAARIDRGDDEDTITKIFKALVPIAEKVLPSVLGFL